MAHVSSVILFISLYSSIHCSFVADFCRNDLTKTDRTFSEFPIEVGYLYACCAEKTSSSQSACFETSHAVIPLVMFNLERILAKIEMSRVAPSVTDNPKFDAYSLSGMLHKAMDGWGTDEGTLIRVFSSLSSRQRQKVAINYRKRFKNSLRSDIRGDTSGDFEKLLTGLVLVPEEHDAFAVRDAIAPQGTKHDQLVDVIGTSSVNEMLHAREAYQRFYNSSMERDLEKELHVQGPYRDLLLLLCSRYSNSVNNTLVKQIVSSSRQCSSGDFTNFARALLVLYKSGEHGRHFHFAERLRSTMAGIGTEDSQLISLVISRAERDLKAVQESYLSLYGHSLASDLKGDLSGDYLSLILKLL